MFAKRPWLRFLTIVAIGAILAVWTSEPMRSLVLRALAGGFFGASIAILLHIDGPPLDRLPGAVGCGVLFFLSTVFGWASSPNATAEVLLIGAAMGILMAWAVVNY
jgi:hypothetical protein